MLSLFSRYKLIVVGVIGLLLIGTITWLLWPEAKPVVLEEETPAPVVVQVDSSVIGQSVEGRAIETYSYGEGETHILFVGGIHGGYEWNSTLLAYDMMELLEEDPGLIPENIKVTIIPSANPDGLYKVIPKEERITWDDVPNIVASTEGAGRMNANGVDLNRNFDCKWQPESSWRGNVVSAGTAAFSEPEAAAIRDFVLVEKPKAVIFWHSQANAVYASECQKGILPVTLDVMNAYASAGGYTAVESFDYYPVTGDAEGWLASIGIPAITVELSSHETTDWTKNLAGVKAVIEYFAGK